MSFIFNIYTIYYYVVCLLKKLSLEELHIGGIENRDDVLTLLLVCIDLSIFKQNFLFYVSIVYKFIDTCRRKHENHE